MRTRQNDSAYEPLQQRLTQELVTSIRSSLQEAGIRGTKLRQLTEEISFSVTGIVDGSAYIDFGDDHLVPILGFAEGPMRDRLLLPEEGGGSEMHEFVPGIVEETFNPAPEIGNDMHEDAETPARLSSKRSARTRRKRSAKSASNRALKRTRRKRRAA